MELILDFLVRNYLWFLIITLILLFALIGYLVDNKKDDRFSKKIEIDKEIESRLDVAAAANLTLNQMVKKQSEDSLNQVTATAQDQGLASDNGSLINQTSTDAVEQKH